MNVVDFIEAWWLSVQAILESADVTGRFERWNAEGMNPSCNLNLRRRESEADLMVWESGEAELAVGEVGGVVDQQHFDDIRNPQDLIAVLSRLGSYFVKSSQS